MSWWEWLVSILIILFVMAGIVESIANAGLGPKLNDWPRHKVGRLPRDSHAQARQDGAFVDGMITGVVLDELEDMFK